MNKFLKVGVKEGKGVVRANRTRAHRRALSVQLPAICSVPDAVYKTRCDSESLLDQGNPEASSPLDVPLL